MAKRVGISRVRQKRATNNNKNNKNGNKNLLENKSIENKSISDLFSDFDLSDIRFDSNSTNNSFKSTKNLLNCDPMDHSFATKSDSNISMKSSINDFNTNDDTIGVKTRSALKSKSFVSHNTSTASTSNANKRKSESVFDGFDLSDLKFDTSLSSFRSSRKVVRTEDTLISNSPNLSNKENSNSCDIQFTKINSCSEDLNEVPESQPNIPSNVEQIQKQSLIPEYVNCFDPKIGVTSISDSNECVSDLTKNLVFEEKVIQSNDKNNNLVKSSESYPNSSNLSNKQNNVFKGFDLSDVKFTDSLNSFRSASKAINSIHKTDDSTNYSSFFKMDSKCDKSVVKEKTRKSIISNIFEDFDFNDFKFNESHHSFRNSRTAYQSLESTAISLNSQTIDWNEMKDIFNQSFNESQEFRTSSPKPKTSSPKIKSKSLEPKSTSLNPELKKSKENDFSFEIDDEFFDSCLERTELKSENLTKDSNPMDIKMDLKEEESMDSLQDISFSLRSDYATHNESTSQEFFSELDEQDYKVGNNVNVSHMGFSWGSGQLIHLSEEQLSSAKLIFKDIEEWLLKEIIENKIEFRECQQNSNTYSQRFVSHIENSGHKSGSNLLVENESIETFAQIMSSTNDNLL